MPLRPQRASEPGEKSLVLALPRFLPDIDRHPHALVVILLDGLDTALAHANGQPVSFRNIYGSVRSADLAGVTQYFSGKLL